MPADPRRVKELFAAAIAVAAADRPAFLDRECGPDAELRERLGRLLAAHDAPLSDLERPLAVDATADVDFAATRTGVGAADATGDDPGRDIRPDSVIGGKYTLAEAIGEGGMGSVWRARQTEPVRRFVAVKLIKAGMDSKQVLTRFEAERQALALMDHPNIAKVLDGGLHDGRPYFVMELVKGTPITDFCDANRYTPHQRLELFVQACQAIQHAHQKGVIHRDIKPSNVLVALYDDRPVVKVIDFGVAKATGGTLTEKTIDTGFGGVVGTPQYMSPEQATFNNLDIDTRSDVYALGVLLYELLAGSPPFSGADLKKKGLLEILRVVREEEPPRPSTKLSTAGALPSISANRGTEPKKLTGLLRNELDWIVMKALEKDRARRYETANGFAADVQRYLAGEPVLAHPPSRAYRLRKFVRRNRGQVLAAGLVFLALVAGVVGTSWQAIRAERARDAEAERAEGEARAKQQALEAAAAEKAAKDAEVLAKQDADRRRHEAETNLAFAKKGNEILGSVFVGLDPVRNYETLADFRNALKANLARAVKELDGAAIGDPLAVADMQHTLGLSLLGLGEYVQAAELFGKARATYTAQHGPEHPDSLLSTYHLANTYEMDGKLKLAIPLLEKTLELATKVHGADHEKTIQTMNSLGTAYHEAGMSDRGVPLLEKVVKLRTARFGADATDTLVAKSNLGNAYRDLGKARVALPLFEEVFEAMKKRYPPHSTEVMTARNNLAVCHNELHQFDHAEPLAEESLRVAKAGLGPDHPMTIRTMTNLAQTYLERGKVEQALTLHSEASRLGRAKLGPDHPTTLTADNNLAMAYHFAGKPDQALALFEDVVKTSKAKLGADHPITLSTMANLSELLYQTRQVERAIRIREEALNLGRAKQGADYRQVFTALRALGEWHMRSGNPNKAIPFLIEEVQRREERYGPVHMSVLQAMNTLGVAYWQTRQFDKSIPLYETMVARTEKTFGPDHKTTLETKANLGVNYNGAGRSREAVRLLEAVYSAGKQIPAIRSFGQELADAYHRAGETAKVMPLLMELLADSRQKLPKDSPALAGELARIAMQLLDLRKYAAAEPLLRESLSIREKAQPAAWTTGNTQSMLGGALLGQKKYADAEPLLLKGYEWMKQREKAIPPQAATRIPEALDRLIELYTALKKPDEVKTYRELRATYPLELAPPPKAGK